MFCHEKSKFNETQIVKILKEYDLVNLPTFYSWKKKYSGMSSSQLKELKSLQEENARLKRMYADFSLYHHILKDVIEKSFKAL